MKKIIIFLFITISLTGCYNHQELNNISIATASYITKKDDQYHISVQIANPNTSSNTKSAEQPDFVTFDSKGTSIHEAYRNLVTKSARRLYLNHLQVLIIDEKLAKEDLSEVIDFIIRYPEVRMEFYVLISKNSEENILKIVTPLTNLSAESIEDNLVTTSKYIGTASLTTFSDLVENYLNTKNEIALPTLEIIEEETTNQKNEKKDTEEQQIGESLDNIKSTDAKTDIKITNMTIFKDNKLIKYLNKEESLGYNFVIGEVDQTLIQYKCNKNNNIVVQLTNTKTETKVSKNKPKVNISIKGNGNITEVGCKLDLTDTKTIEDIEKKINNKIENIIKESVNKIIKEYKTDVFGFEDLFYKNSNNYYKTIEKQWEQILPKLDIEVTSKVNIFAKGSGVKGVITND